MPTGTPLSQAQRLLRSIVADLTQLAKLAEQGEADTKRIGELRALFAAERQEAANA